MRGELNEVWAELSDLRQATPPPQPGSASSPAYFQERRQNSTSAAGVSTLLPASFQYLMRQVIDELHLSGCVFRTNLDAQTSRGVQADTIDQIVKQVSALSRCVGSLEREFSGPDGTIGKLESRIKILEKRCLGETIERGGWLFRDVVLVNTWVQIFKDKGLFCYCVDMVTLIMLCAEPYKTIAEGMANAAAAHIAEFNDLTEAWILLSYGLTYPDNIIRKQDKEKYAATGGWFWTNTWSSYAVFKGTFNNGAKDTITCSLVELSRMIQNAVDFSFPSATHPIAHAVFTEQLLILRQQASGWIEALKPLYEILCAAGMSTDEAGERVLIFTKAIFDDVQTVRAIHFGQGQHWRHDLGKFLYSKATQGISAFEILPAPPHFEHACTYLSPARGKEGQEGHQYHGGIIKDGGDASV